MAAMEILKVGWYLQSHSANDVSTSLAFSPSPPSSNYFGPALPFFFKFVPEEERNLSFVSPSLRVSLSDRKPLLSSMSMKHAQVSSGGSKYRGLEPQPNGRWDTQIYHNQQQHLCLSTFDTQEAAANGFRGPDAVVSFTDVDEEGDDDDDNSDEKCIHPTAAEEFQSEENRQGEVMFEKPLTPSDVGKLNRLVIPKQYAERYFPLPGRGDSVLKGLQLSFEDEGGKVWRFRYSYWNSSQSYVLTKGWSRYVKEKKLNAGNVVSFHRRGEGRLGIRWRRRQRGADVGGESVPSVRWGPAVYPLPAAHPAHPSATLMYVSGEREDGLLRGHAGQQIEVSPPAANSKRLRLFGVNLDCPFP